MNQATLDLDTLQAQAGDHTGFELGWDHAHHGLVPPAGLLLDGTPIGQGWRAGKAVFGRRTLAATRQVRLWLQLRTQAWRLGLAFEDHQVTPNYLAQIEVGHCPVMRQPLGGALAGDDTPTVTRLNQAAGYAAGHLAVLSARAARQLATEGLDARCALRRAARLDAGIEATPVGWSVDQAWRAAVLASFTTALPFAEALRVPLRVLPPNRVRVLNAVQGLQVLLTLQFASPGWSQRLRAMADQLPHPALRPDFNAFVGALAPRLLEAGPLADTRSTRRALEDAWRDARLNRRWQQLTLALGETGVQTLLTRCAQGDLAGVRTHWHEPEQATEGWALATAGRAVKPTRQMVPATAPAQRPNHPRKVAAPQVPATGA